MLIRVSENKHFVSSTKWLTNFEVLVGDCGWLEAVVGLSALEEVSVGISVWSH